MPNAHDAVGHRLARRFHTPSEAMASSFGSPSAPFRAAPFWSWNDDLDPHRLKRQIDQLARMGFGGFHIHVRTGLRVPYLGPVFMERVRQCVEHAAADGLLAWLYDEDRWPSGYAGGLVTDEPRFRQRYLLFTPRPDAPTPPALPAVTELPVPRNERGCLLARYEIRLRDGALAHYRRLTDGEPAAADADVWYAYLETQWPCQGWNNQTLADMFNAQATDRFIALTHERYRQSVGRHFGAAVPAIFMDEPHPIAKCPLPAAGARADVILPFTDDFVASYRAAYDADLLATLPEVIWDLPDQCPSVTRWRYHDHVAERLVSGFVEPIAAWCAANGIASTGHMVEETTLESQTVHDGEVMRGYRALHLPGIDLLYDTLQLNTAKQAQSAARQMGRPGVLSELYGLTGWACPLATFKGQGDWQAALGVTVRVPHLNWVSMAGEAKRDCPGPIGYQQPWWRYWPIIEDHFARLNVVLTHGLPVVRLAVIHPIESYWLSYGPQRETAADRHAMDERFAALTDWLLRDLIDFDFVAESLLPQLAGDDETGKFTVGAMRYEVVIVPPLRTMRGSTLRRLEAFADAGGTVLFLGDPPTLVDVEPSDGATRLAARCSQVPFERSAVLAALQPWRELAIATRDGRPVPPVVGQLRQNGEERYLFVCNTTREGDTPNVLLTMRGRWDVVLMDTATGAMQQPMPSRVAADWTQISHELPPAGHLLVRLLPRTQADEVSLPTPAAWRAISAVPEPTSIHLDEPNTLLLSQATWRWNDEPWQPPLGVRAIEDAIRQRHGVRVRRSYCAQPWCDASEPIALGTLTLAFEFHCDVALPACRLGIEQPSQWQAQVDGTPIDMTDVGWWVDEAIRTVPLPPLRVGRHRLTLTTTFTHKTEIEAAYLLGDFGVRLDDFPTLTAPVRSLRWGDWTKQGLPFYTGNVTCDCAIDAPGGMLALHAPPGNAPLLGVKLDDRDAGTIAFPPYRLALGQVAAGPHQLAITIFGHRLNAFDSRRGGGDDSACPIAPMGVTGVPILETIEHG